MFRSPSGRAPTTKPKLGISLGINGDYSADTTSGTSQVVVLPDQRSFIADVSQAVAKDAKVYTPSSESNSSLVVSPKGKHAVTSSPTHTILTRVGGMVCSSSKKVRKLDFATKEEQVTLSLFAEHCQEKDKENADNNKRKVTKGLPSSDSPFKEKRLVIPQGQISEAKHVPKEKTKRPQSQKSVMGNVSAANYCPEVSSSSEHWGHILSYRMCMLLGKENEAQSRDNLVKSSLPFNLRFMPRIDNALVKINSEYEVGMYVCVSLHPQPAKNELEKRQWLHVLNRQYMAVNVSSLGRKVVIDVCDDRAIRYPQLYSAIGGAMKTGMLRYCCAKADEVHVVPKKMESLVEKKSESEIARSSKILFFKTITIACEHDERDSRDAKKPSRVMAMTL